MQSVLPPDCLILAVSTAVLSWKQLAGAVHKRHEGMVQNVSATDDQGLSYNICPDRVCWHYAVF